MALSKLRLCDLFWVAWTEFGSVGEGRRAVVTQIDRKRHTPSHPGLDPAFMWLYARAKNLAPHLLRACSAFTRSSAAWDLTFVNEVFPSHSSRAPVFLSV